MSTIATLTTKFTSDTKGFDRGVQNIRRGIWSTEGGLGGLSKVVRGGIGVAAVGAGAALYKLGTQFQDSSNTIRRETGATGKSLDGLNESVKRVYATRPENLEQVTQTIATLNRQSGATGPTLESLARTNLRLASITKEELAPQLKATQGLMNNWGVSAEQQGPKLDVLYRTFQKTGVGVTQLANTMSSQGVVLRQLGLGYEESAAMIGLLDKAGVSASQMQMGFNRVIVEAAKAGIPARDMFGQIFDRIRNAPSETAAAGAAVDVFGARAGPRLAGLIREGKLSFDDLASSIAGGSDTIDKAAAETATGAGRMKIAWHSLQVAVEPIATALVRTFADVAKVVVDVMKALGPATTPIIMTLLGLLGTLAVAFKIAGVAATLFGTTTAVAFWPVTAVIAGIAALVAAVVLVVKHFKAIVDFLKGPWGQAILIAIAASAPFIGVPLLIATNWKKIVGFFAELWDTVKGIFSDAVDAIVGFFTALPDTVVGSFSALPGRILAALAALPGLLVQAGQAMIKGLLDGAQWFFFNVFIPWIVLMPIRILGLVLKAGTWLFETGQSIIKGALDGIVAAWPVVRDWFVALPGRVLNLLVNAGNWLIDTGRRTLVGLANGIAAGAEAVWAFFRALPGRILGFVTGAPGWLADTGRKLIAGLKDGIVAGAEAVWKFFRELPSNIKNLLGDAAKWLVDTGRNIVQGMIDGIKDFAGKLWEAVKSALGDALPKWARKLLGISSPSKVFMEIGEEVGAGMALGILSSVGDVVSAAGELAAAATVATPSAPTAPAATTGPAPDAGGLLDFQAAAQSAFTAAGDAALGYATALELAVAGQASALATMGSATASFTAAESSAWSGLSSGVQGSAATLSAALIATFISAWAQLRASTAALHTALQAAWLAHATFLRSALTSLAAALQAIWQGLASTLIAIITNLSAGVRSSWSSMINAVVFNAGWMRDQLTSIWRSMATNVDQISHGMVQRFTAVMNAMVAAATSGGFNTSFQLRWHLDQAQGPIEGIVRGYARKLRDSLNPILQGIGKSQIKLPFASGGRVPGTPGGGDTVPAMLTPGEFVIPARAAARLGPKMLDQLREGWLPVRGYQLGGAVQEAANRLTKQFGLVVTSTFRPGDPGFHGKGQAVDLSGGAWGPGGPMGRASNYIMQSGMFRSLAEGIFNPALSVKWGKQVDPGFWGAGTWAGHANHIHLAITGQGVDFGGFAVTEPVLLPDVPDVKTGGEWFGGTAKKVMEHVRKVAQQWADANTFVESLTGGGAPTGPVPPGSVRNWISQALEYGKWPVAWMGALFSRVMQETGGNPHAINLWDSNAKAGIPSKGLVQTIEPTFNAYKAPSMGDIWNPVHNLVAGIKYMIARYGSPLNLPSGGYAAGGIVPATSGGRHILAGEGGRDEAVIPLPAGWRGMFDGGRGDSLSPAAGQQRSGPAVQIENYVVKEEADHRRIFAMARFEQQAGKI